MKKLRKRILVYGLVTVLAFGNIIVTIANEKHKTLLISNNVEAKASILPAYLLYLILNDINGGNSSGPTHYKYLERNNLNCSPVSIFNGQVAKNSSQARSVDAAVGMNGETYNTVGKVGGNASLDYAVSKSVASSYDFHYYVTITPTGNDWRFYSCVQCTPDDNDCLGTSCSDYDECAHYVNSQGNAYRAALGLS